MIANLLLIKRKFSSPERRRERIKSKKKRFLWAVGRELIQVKLVGPSAELIFFLLSYFLDENWPSIYWFDFFFRFSSFENLLFVVFMSILSFRLLLSSFRMKMIFFCPFLLRNITKYACFVKKRIKWNNKNCFRMKNAQNNVTEEVE